ncbi:unnamed protein product, partial [Lymnaea stagnalis]
FVCVRPDPCTRCEPGYKRRTHFCWCSTPQLPSSRSYIKPEVPLDHSLVSQFPLQFKKELSPFLGGQILSAAAQCSYSSLLPSHSQLWLRGPRHAALSCPRKSSRENSAAPMPSLRAFPPKGHRPWPLVNTENSWSLPDSPSTSLRPLGTPTACCPPPWTWVETTTRGSMPATPAFSRIQMMVS